MKNLYYLTNIFKRLNFTSQETDEYYEKIERKYGLISNKTKHLKNNYKTGSPISSKNKNVKKKKQ